METKTRGLYFSQNGKSVFMPALKITEVVKTLNEFLVLTPEKSENLLDVLYTSVANYAINDEFCWLSLDQCGEGYNLTWGVSTLIKASNLTNEAIAAVYYVWKQSCCFPEEACRVLNISLEDLMALSAQFDKLR
jgi:hypothetical protein